jgi:hypothetical protein
MHKHVCNDLPNLKRVTAEIVTGQWRLQGRKCSARHEDQHVDDEEVFGDNR